MKNNRPWIVMAGLLALLGAPMSAPTPAYACYCFYPTSAQQALDGAYVAFIGKVVAFEEQTYQSSGDPETYILKSAIFEVTAVYKGTVGPKAIISTTLTDCDYEFREGVEMLVFAYKHQGVSVMHPDLYETNVTEYGERLHTSDCHGTTRLNSGLGLKVKTELGLGTPPVVHASQNGLPPEQSGGGGIPWMAIGPVLVALVTVGVAIIFVLLKHMTKKAAS